MTVACTHNHSKSPSSLSVEEPLQHSPSIHSIVVRLDNAPFQIATVRSRQRRPERGIQKIASIKRLFSVRGPRLPRQPPGIKGASQFR